MVRQLQFTKTALQAPRRGVMGDNLSFVDCAWCINRVKVQEI
jgi:hypothetical protein